MPIDTVVLGCTHYPLVESEIVQAFARLRGERAADGSTPFGPLVSERIQVVDPARWTAEDLWRALEASNLRAPAVRGESSRDLRDLFFISVANPDWPGVQRSADGGLTREFKYGRDAGEPGREDTVIVPMRLEELPASSANLVRTRLPAVAASLGRSGS
jgi:hypothetical protein